MQAYQFPSYAAENEVVAERFGKGENDCILQGEIIGRTDNGLAAKTVEKMVRR